MNRDEHVRFRETRAADTVTQNQEFIAIACQDRTHSRLAVDALREGSRDRQHYVFFPRAAVANRAGILAAVAGIDRHHNVAAAVDRSVGGTNDFRSRVDFQPALAPRPPTCAADASPRVTTSCRPPDARCLQPNTARWSQ